MPVVSTLTSHVQEIRRPKDFPGTRPFDVVAVLCLVFDEFRSWHDPGDPLCIGSSVEPVDERLVHAHSNPRVALGLLADGIETWASRNDSGMQVLAVVLVDPQEGSRVHRLEKAEHPYRLRSWLYATSVIAWNSEVRYWEREDVDDVRRNGRPDEQEHAFHSAVGRCRMKDSLDLDEQVSAEKEAVARLVRYIAARVARAAGRPPRMLPQHEGSAFDSGEGLVADRAEVIADALAMATAEGEEHLLLALRPIGRERSQPQWNEFWEWATPIAFQTAAIRSKAGIRDALRRTGILVEDSVLTPSDRLIHTVRNLSARRIQIGRDQLSALYPISVTMRSNQRSVRNPWDGGGDPV